MIRLEGGFELDEYWREIERVCAERLDEHDLDGWVVTLRPLSRHRW